MVVVGLVLLVVAFSIVLVVGSSMHVVFGAIVGLDS